MAWFFANDAITTEYYTIAGEDAAHISRSLRMKVGEELTLCTPDGRRHECEITAITREDVTVRILGSTDCEQEPDVKVSLYVALMKGDKIDDVVQKAVELGAYEITPFLSARCISRPDEKSMSKKLARWQKIADNAASQSRRGVIPRVNPCISLRDIPEAVKNTDASVVFYECGGRKLREIIGGRLSSLALITGSEGGFEQEEIDFLSANGVEVATLGKRILRAQTAPVAALCAAMLLTGNLE
ncbi:MAG: 16S rRNA (uracil(1498)-N(3))-methyltransferase [Ruminococcus sp.]|uniref:RsmE family RNA methyltransferase n=1 Tax=Ruminococcus sp. TaxID=41978 RepID=UPI002873E1B3|nr:RsmE family RNA methyltransferase [Ruminococcus sp.]MBQ3284391.1 16S rRNA (uracil(1498)-N(3))-methyltransferase [Ruminococcus sp.]